MATAATTEFIICASKDTHIEQARAKLGGAGLEEIPGGDTTITAGAGPKLMPGSPGGGFPQQRGGQHQHRGGQRRPHRENRTGGPTTNARPLLGKPYGFVSLPNEFATSPPIWHDGNRSAGRLSGEIRFELETLTPLLVGWERGQVGDNESDWPLPANLANDGQLANKKSVLCPLRAPWGKRPVIIPGDSLKGLLRHELGALLGAPMERVAERSYSYRPNQKFPYDQRDPRYRLGTAYLEPRLARVRTSTTVDIGGRAWPVLEQVDVLSMAMRDHQAYFPRREHGAREVIRPTREAEPYKGGLGGGKALPDAVLAEDARRKLIHTHIEVSQLRVEHEAVSPAADVIARFTMTLTHLLDVNDGHFSARHPHIGTDQEKQRLGREAIESGAARAFQPGDLVWVEWDTEKKCIVSLGWHYYYRWAYTDSVRKDADAPRLERHGLFPLEAERERDDDGAPTGLSAVRRLFGYTITDDNEGSAGIGEKDHSQLMGRVFVNAGLEVVGENESDDDRFLPPTFLKELGLPRPSAVEHYLKQPHHPRSRPSDNATLVTYGDAAGYDAPGELAGRKFYLDREDAYGTDEKGRVPGPAADPSEANKQNDRSTLAFEASRPGRKFLFTVRFRDLDATELAAIVVALCPDHFKGVLGGTHTDGYCSKLGYARPLGWGSVRIEARSLFFLDEASHSPELKPETDLNAWVKRNHQKTSTQDEWLAIHRRNHRNAADYPRARDRDGNENIYTYHTTLRAEHSRNRRYKKDGSR
ncbi:MAG: hypothetical protein ACYC61_07320 [Isosphaeraceae bacterium]